MSSGRARILGFYFALGIFSLGVVELAAYAGCRVLARTAVIYTPFQNSTYAQYLQIREPVLGWPSPGKYGAGGQYDVTGSRISPAFPDPFENPPRISLYGDSFTYGDEVEHSAAWSNVLAGQLGYRVSNFGVGGYGTDQALLRFLSNKQDDAGVVVLNHLSENILRNVNQYRQLLYPGNGLGFKPRYIVKGESGIELVPLPTFSASEYHDVVESPGDYLPFEYFSPGGASGSRKMAFPYTWNLLLSLGHFHIASKIKGEPWYLEFYRSDHPSGALEVTARIMQEFHRAALEQDRYPILTVIPTGLDILYFRETGAWPYQPLVDRLSDRNISVLDFGPRLVEMLGQADPGSIYITISGHFNERGNQLLAEIFTAYLGDRLGTEHDFSAAP